MRNSTIYYQGSNERSRKVADILATRLEGEMVNAERVQTDYLHFRDTECMGFIFEARDGKVPADIDWVIRHMVVRKSVYVFLIVVGGRHEMAALKTASHQLTSRGYQVSGLYTESLLEQEHIPREEWADYITTSCRKQINRHDAHMEKLEDLSSSDLKRGVRRSVRDYVLLRREKRQEVR